jgi:hypothetical protein
MANDTDRMRGNANMTNQERQEAERRVTANPPVNSPTRHPLQEAVEKQQLTLNEAEEASNREKTADAKRQAASPNVRRSQDKDKSEKD